MRKPVVTDHAAIRYLERVYGVDIKALKRRIAKSTEEGRKAGASAVLSDGVRYTLSPAGNVTSVTGVDGPETNRRRRWKARRK